jgi:hypothetical protein
VPSMALIALYARMARSTNRSTATTARGRSRRWGASIYGWAPELPFGRADSR